MQVKPAYGYADPRWAFTSYFSTLPLYRQTEIERVILAFTRDDPLVLGPSVSTSYNLLEAEAVAGEARADELLAHLATSDRFHSCLDNGVHHKRSQIRNQIILPLIARDR